MAEKRRVMLVDDEELIVQGLKRALRPLHDTWEVFSATSGPAALEILASTPADLVISDMRMPEMTGVQLLTEVRRRSPGTIRVVLSGQAEDAAALRVLPVAHRYFSKPTESATLRAMLGRAAALKTALPDPAIQAALGAIDFLSIPRAIREELASTKDLDVVTAIVEQTPALGLKILQAANSDFFGSRLVTSDIAEAVGYLGIGIVKAIGAMADSSEAPIACSPAMLAYLLELWGIPEDALKAFQALVFGAGVGVVEPRVDDLRGHRLG